MKNCLTVRVCFSLILTFFFFIPAGLGQINLSQMQALTNSSDLIIVGKVVNSKAEWGKGKKWIYSNVTISVDEFVKGSQANKTIVVTHPGGEIGDVGELYSDVPNFQNNEEVLLFIKKDKEDKLVVNGGNYGKISVGKDKIIKGERTIDDLPVSKVISRIKNILRNKN